MTKDKFVAALIRAHSEGVMPVAPYGADLSGAIHDTIMPIKAAKSGHGALYPTHEGWRISIGCWTHKTLDQFDQLLNDEIEWPEAKGDERDARRPLLTAIRAACDAFIEQHAEAFAQTEKENTK